MCKVITLKNILGVEVTYYGNEVDTSIDFGSITLKRDGREFIFDVIASNREFNEDSYETSISLDVEVDKETFPECPYDLTECDLLSDELSAEIFIESDELSTDETTRTLFVKVGGMTKAIDLKLD